VPLVIEIWNQVTGRQGVYVQSTPQDYEKMWGVGGKELADQLVFGEQVTDWTTGVEMVGMKELGIKQEEVPGLKATLEGLKALL
jgi:hypothetical protein